MKHVNVLMCLDFPKKQCLVGKCSLFPLHSTKLRVSALHLVADGVRLDMTISGVQASNICRDGRMLSRKETEDPDCDRLPGEVNRVWITRTGQDGVVGR